MKRKRKSSKGKSEIPPLFLLTPNINKFPPKKRIFKILNALGTLIPPDSLKLCKLIRTTK
jgi:hypothetical protein